MIAIIPARGGSKGLPGKNIKELLGKPLINYTVEAAKNSKYIISTDSAEIAEIAQRAGAEVPFFRPDSLSTDSAKTIDAIKFTVERLEQREKIKLSEITILQPTSPLRSNNHIDEACELFFNKNASSVISVCKEDHPIFWNKFLKSDLTFSEIFNEDMASKNRQEFMPTYFPNGSIYIVKRKLLKTGNFYDRETFGYVMSKQESVDIDCLCDFELAEFYLSKKMSKVV